MRFNDSIPFSKRVESSLFVNETKPIRTARMQECREIGLNENRNICTFFVAATGAFESFIVVFPRARTRMDFAQLL